MKENRQPVDPLAQLGPVGRVPFHASRAPAIVGGPTFATVVVMSLVSTVGHKLWSALVPGGVEVLQTRSACAARHILAPLRTGG